MSTYRQFIRIGERTTASVEVSTSRPALGFKVSTVGEETLDVAVRTPLFSAYVGITSRRPNDRIRRLPAVRADVDVYVLDRALWFRADLGGTRDDTMTSHPERGVHWLWQTGALVDRALGRKVCTKAEVLRERATLPLPAGARVGGQVLDEPRDVPAELIYELRRWSRPRGWRTSERLDVDVHPSESIEGITAISAPIENLNREKAVESAMKGLLREWRQRQPASSCGCLPPCAHTAA